MLFVIYLIGCVLSYGMQGSSLIRHYEDTFGVEASDIRMALFGGLLSWFGVFTNILFCIHEKRKIGLKFYFKPQYPTNKENIKYYIARNGELK